MSTADITSAFEASVAAAVAAALSAVIAACRLWKGAPRECFLFHTDNERRKNG
ncbi:MAG: hypothetical protein ACOVON_04710 [Sediminibacterium sp.]